MITNARAMMQSLRKLEIGSNRKGRKIAKRAIRTNATFPTIGGTPLSSEYFFVGGACSAGFAMAISLPPSSLLR